MKKLDNDKMRVARYFWVSVLFLTLLVILDVIFGIGLTSSILKFFLPGKVQVKLKNFIEINKFNEKILSKLLRASLNEHLNRENVYVMRAEDVIIPATMNDSFNDLKNLVENPIPDKYSHIIRDVDHLDGPNPTLRDIANISAEE